MPTDVRVIESNDAAEFYITATPSPSVPETEQAREVFLDVEEVLRETNARIFQERVFATPRTMETMQAARAEAYGDLDDGIPPAWLVVPKGLSGEIAGVQVHAVRCDQPLRPLTGGTVGGGRVLDLAGRRYITLSGVSAAEAGSPEAQARAAFEKAESLLQGAGADMFSVARTWLWLGDILSWYDALNSARTDFFLERGLLNNKPGASRMPASTGIGVKPAGDPICSLDLIAVKSAEAAFRCHGAAGNQDSAYQYGSAFSRAAQAAMPAGDTVFVSGTAAIDAQGLTRHIDDAGGQIEMTIDNVRAVLGDMGCREEDVVQAIVYAKNAEVEETFRTVCEDFPWPALIMIADVCRPDLLFEVEATACPGAHDL